MSEQWQWNENDGFGGLSIRDTKTDKAWGVNKDYSHPEELLARLNALEAAAPTAAVDWAKGRGLLDMAAREADEAQAASTWAGMSRMLYELRKTVAEARTWLAQYQEGVS